ncbi:MAG TPA: type II toxin-antitoxin system RelE/ParE family toxin [Caulobacteraceae bacterium]|nr:type II toxin-antitoxin system RelE/ParE family toxin [Caulobacteraceae bacterium]
MIRSVRLTPGADRDLLRLVDFLVEKSPRSAVRAGDAIERGIRSLAQLAERGRQAPIEGAREIVVAFGRNAYVIQYRIAEDEVVVARIFHSLEHR